MEALVKCRACGRDVARHAVVCPGCGQRAPAPTAAWLKKTGKYAVLAAAVIVGAAVIAGLAEPRRGHQPARGTLSAASSLCPTEALAREINGPGAAQFPIHYFGSRGCVGLLWAAHATEIAVDGDLAQVRLSADDVAAARAPGLRAGVTYWVNIATPDSSATANEGYTVGFRRD
jgi:hypothetical protein